MAADERARQESLQAKAARRFSDEYLYVGKRHRGAAGSSSGPVRGQRVAAEQYVDSLHARLSALQTRAQNFKPYNPRPDAHRMPDDVAEDLVHTLNELRTQSNVLTAKNEEETTLKAQFQADIERYRELRAQPQGCSRAPRSAAAGVPEAAAAPRRSREILDDLQLNLHDRYDDQLRNPLAGPDRERLAAPVPTRHHNCPW